MAERVNTFINLPTFDAFEAVELGDGTIIHDLLELTPSIDPLKPTYEGTLLPRFTGREINPDTGAEEDFDTALLPADQPLVIASPNKFGEDSPDCNAQASMLQDLADEYFHIGEPITVVQFGLQTPETLRAVLEHQNPHDPHLVSVTRLTANTLGAGILPAQGLKPDGTFAADRTFWTADTTARTVAVATPVLGGRRAIVHRQRSDDQGAPLNEKAIRLGIKNARAAVGSK